MPIYTFTNMTEQSGAQAGLDFGMFTEQLVQGLSINSEGAAKVLGALLRFLTTKAILKDADATRYSPCPVVDSAWHNLILNTKLYAAVCNALAGEMLHHDPNGSRAQNNAQRAERRSAAIAAHQVLFGCPETMDFDELFSRKRKAAEFRTESSAASFELRVRNLGGKVIRLGWPAKTAASVSVWALAKAYEMATGVPIDQTRFIFDGKSLPRMDLNRSDDDSELAVEKKKAACVALMKATTLESQGVAHDDVLMVVLALSGC